MGKEPDNSEQHGIAFKNKTTGCSKRNMKRAYACWVQTPELCSMFAAHLTKRGLIMPALLFRCTFG